MRLAALALLGALTASPSPARAADATVLGTLIEGVEKDPGFTPVQRAMITTALRARFGKEGAAKNNTAARRDAVQAAAGAVVEGSFDEAPAERIADVAYSAYHAAEKGASPEAAHGIALYGYREKVSSDKIADWATGYTKMVKKDVAPNVAADMVRHALEKGWSAKTFKTFGDDLAKAAKKGVDQDQYASFLVDAFSKNPKKAPGTIVKEASRRFAPAGAEKLLKAKSGKDVARGLLDMVTAPSAKPAPRPAPKPSAPKKPAAPEGPAIPPGAKMAKLWPDLHAEAKSYLGTPYVWGGTTHQGIDCSGFTQASYHGVKVRIPRVSRDQWQFGDKAVDSDLRPGDLVFFNTMGAGVSHVGLVVNAKGPMVYHASSSRGVMEIDMSKKWFKDRYLGARRVVP